MTLQAGSPPTAPTRQPMSPPPPLHSVPACNAPQGAAEIIGGGRTGAMLGARGCVESLPNSEYLVTVAWQGLAPISAPPTSIACGLNLYNAAVSSTSSNCAADRCRRVVTTVVRIA